MAGTNTLSNTLDSKELDSLSPAVKYKLEVAIGSKVTEVEGLRSKYEKLRVNSEQQYFELEKQLITTNSLLETEKTTNTDTQSKLSELEKQYSEAKGRVQEQEKEITTLQTQKMEMTNASQLLQAEKRDLNSFLEKRDKDLQRLKDDLKEVNEKLSSANKEKCNAQAELMKIEASNISRQYREKRMEQEKDQLQKQVDWLNTQLSEKTKELVTFRREKASKMLELQGSVEEKTEEISHHHTTIEALKAAKEKQAAKIESLAQKLKEARDLQTTADEQYRQELAAQTRLVNLYKASTKENTDKVTELTRAVGELQKLLKEANTAYGQLETTKTEEANKLKDIVRERELKIEKMEVELRNANDLLAAKKSGTFTVTQEEVETMYPAAAVTSKLLKSGMTLTQIYSEYVQAVENLEVQKEDNKRLNSYLDQILQEIEDKAPQLKKQREDYEAALQTLDQLTPQLDAAMLECEKLRTDNEELKRRTHYFQRENTRTQQRNIDLSRQVKFLVKEIQEVKGGCVVADDEAEVSSSQDTSASSRIITEKLVTFRNIEELQERNQQLLESLRDLSKQRDEEELVASDTRVTELKQQLEEAARELEQLRTDRTRHAEMVEAIVRQRDMYRVLLQQQGGSAPVSPHHPLTSTPMPASQAKDRSPQRQSSADVEKALSDSQMALREMQGEYNTYRKEKMENEKILNEQLEKTRNELSESRVQNARIASQVDHAAERYKILQSNAESYRKEIAALQDKCQKYNTSVAKHELTITKLKEDVFEKQQLASTWEAKVDQMRAQYDTLRTHEQRLLAELESMRRERQSQAMLTANLQAIQNNLERAEFESKTRYTNQIDSMEKELALLRRKLQCTEEEKSTSVGALETRVKGLEAELTKAKEMQEKLKTETENAKKELQDNLQELSAAEAKLAAAENKLTNLGTAEEGMPAEEEIKDLRNELTQLKQHLKNQQAQLKAARQQADQYKAIAEGVEQNLRQSNQTSKEFQESCENKMIEAQNAKAALEKRVEQLEKDHQDLLTENIRITEDSHNLNNDLRKQLASLRHELQEALQTRESALAEQTAAQQALQKQVDLAAEAQDKYQRELMLHAADVEALTALKRKLESHNDDLAKAQSETEGEKQKLLNAQTSWQEQERVLREESRQLETRCEELEKQNKTLHSQMETLSNQAIAVQQKAAGDPHNLSLSEEAGKSSEQLLEVIKFLRREKEIAETKLEVTESSTTRLQQRLTILEKQLEETKQALGEERQQNQTSVQTMSQHMELMRKVETVNLLQESNKLLREENTRLQSVQQEMEAKVRRLEEEISPLQASVRETTAQKEVLEVEKKTLTAEVERWKSRTHHLVEQSNKTDPEEHRKLMQEKDQIRKQLAQTKEELFKMRAECSRLNGIITTKETDVNNQRQEMTKKVEELQESKKLLEEEQREGEKKNTTINQLKKIGRKYKEQSEAIQKELDQLKAASAGQQTQQTSAAAAAEQANKQLTDRLAAVEKERDDVKAKITQSEAEVTSLKEQIQKLQQDLAQQQENLQKQQAESTRLQTENARLQTDSSELEKKQTQSRTVLQTARNRITQQKEQIERLNTEIAELKNRATSAGEAALRSQYEQQVGQLQRELEESRRGSASVASGVQSDQLQQERERLATENSELQNRVQQLQRQVEMMSKATPAQPAQPMPRQATSSGTSPTSTETPKMASIKPVATAAAAPAMQHTSSQAKATASIRPMAIASANTSSTATSLPPYPSTSSTPPIVTVMPTTVLQPEPQPEDQPSTSGVQQQASIPAASVTGRPQQQVQIVAPQMESSVEPSMLVEETTAQAVVAPSIQEPMHNVQPSQQQAMQMATPSTSTLPPSVPGPSTSTDQPAVHLGKRTREDTEMPDEMEAKRSRVTPTQEAAVIPTITVMDENSKVVTQIEPQQDTEGTVISAETGEEVVEQAAAGQMEGESQDMGTGQEDNNGDIIVVNSDEEQGQTAGQEGEETQQVEEEIEEDTEEEGESEEMEEEEFEEEEEQEGELDEEGMPGEGAGEEEEDNDVVIIDIDETDTPGPVASLEEDTPASSQAATTSSPRPPPPPLQPMSAHTERLPSTSRQLTPFLLQGQGGAFEDDDCMVPSTPTLTMPRRNDGFAEALNSPHIAQRFVFGAGSEGGNQPELAQLESQRALGMDDTRMDLSQFDEGGARSIPTTPVPQQASAPVSFESVAAVASTSAVPVPSATTATATAASTGQDTTPSTSAPSTSESSGAQGEGQNQSTSGEAAKPEEEASGREGQEEEETEASLLEGGAGDEEENDESKGASKPRIQRIVWDSPQSSSQATASTSSQPQPQQQQQQQPSRAIRSRGLRHGAVPTRPTRGAYAWRGGARGGVQHPPQHPRGMGNMRRGGPRGGYQGQF